MALPSRSPRTDEHAPAHRPCSYLLEPFLVLLFDKVYGPFALLLHDELGLGAKEIVRLLSAPWLLILVFLDQETVPREEFQACALAEVVATKGLKAAERMIADHIAKLPQKHPASQNRRGRVAVDRTRRRGVRRRRALAEVVSGAGL